LHFTGNGWANNPGWFQGQGQWNGWFPGWGQQGWAQQGWNPLAWGPGWGQVWGQEWGPQALAQGNALQQGFNQPFANQNFPANGALPNLSNLNSAENFQARFVGNFGPAPTAAGSVASNKVDSIKPIIPGSSGAAALRKVKAF
jgi:hypothetical protein